MKKLSVTITVGLLATFGYSLIQTTAVAGRRPISDLSQLRISEGVGL